MEKYILMLGQVSSVGVPWNWRILKIWSISQSPAKSGFLSISSAKMQPTAHVSTPREYLR